MWGGSTYPQPSPTHTHPPPHHDISTTGWGMLYCKWSLVKGRAVVNTTLLQSNILLFVYYLYVLWLIVLSCQNYNIVVSINEKKMTPKTCSYFLTCTYWYTVLYNRSSGWVRKILWIKIFMHIKIYCHYRVQEYHVRIKIKLE